MVLREWVETLVAGLCVILACASLGVMFAACVGLLR